jgi:protein SCO1/2
LLQQRIPLKPPNTNQAITMANNILRCGRMALVSMLLVTAAALAQERTTKSCCTPRGAGGGVAITIGGVTIPDPVLTDQNGKAVHLHELIAGRAVVMNFIFTTCTTICPPMGANFARLRDLLEPHLAADVAMISVTLDPATDTPERLKAWSERFNAGPGWTLLTGSKRDVEGLLKALKVYAAVKENHSPTILIGSAGRDWVRANGLTEPAKLAAIVDRYLPRHAGVARPPVTQALAEPALAAQALAAQAVAPPIAASPAGEIARASAHDDDPSLKYFTDVKLVNQFGEEMRLYTDLLKGKIVVINPFFAECTGSCPAMNTSMEKIQKYLGDRLGRDVNLISITVDPTNDIPGKLGDYAARFHARRGWYFLSGNPANVQAALYKLGQQVDVRENHKTIILMGNLQTRLWKKVNGLSSAEEIIKVLQTVMNDRGPKE